MFFLSLILSNYFEYIKEKKKLKYKFNLLLLSYKFLVYNICN